MKTASREPTGTTIHSAILLPAMALAILAAVGCARTTSGKIPVGASGSEQNIVRAARLDDRRVAAHKTDASTTGDVIKQWRWDRPWEVRNAAGEVIRRMYGPDSARQIGPTITVIDDPKRGTIYEAHFVQQTGKRFDLPMTLYFFGARDASTPLFSLSFTDAALRNCQEGRVSRGGIQAPGIPRSLVESAEWVAVSWTSVPYHDC
ncbi:hypothetical protein [Nitrospira moscoviensis]|uniref:Lipoprotein n=1 Tax=Nitrospira moscoviensis TaxID=42253 RepID=A0A0K2G9A4_NITMO|nr:hypothetical protein [Nitrospira moscoviensis]ALA57551.1 exported protein of unknown function [Nitrospira moscoviensis]